MVIWSRDPTGMPLTSWMMCRTYPHPIRTQRIEITKKAPTERCKCLIFLARLKGFEPLTYGLEVNALEFPNLLKLFNYLKYNHFNFSTFST